MWKELWGIPATAVRCFLCVFWAGDGKAWQAPRCTAAHKFRQDCSSFGLLLVSHLQWECSGPVTNSWEILTAGARSHQAAGWWTAPADSSVPRQQAVEGWLKQAVLYLLFPQSELCYCQVLLEVALGLFSHWQMLILSQVAVESLLVRACDCRGAEWWEARDWGAAMCAWSDPLPSARTSCQT